MTADQEKMFYEIIDNLKGATTKEEKDRAIDAFIKKYTVRGSDDQPTGEAQKKESEGTKEFARYRVQTEDLLGHLCDDIEKANTILGEFQDDYCFKGGMRGCRVDWDFEGNKNLVKWACEYDRIMQHLDIVGDYIIKVMVALRERSKKAE